MTLKHRLKRIEDRIKPTKPGFKMWLVRTNYGVKDFKRYRPDMEPVFEGLNIEKMDDREKADIAIQAIKDGKVKHKDGTYYQEGDSFMLLSVIFTPKNLEDIDEREPVYNFDFGKNDTTEEDDRKASVESRIEALKQRKKDLELKIAEGGE